MEFGINKHFFHNRSRKTLTRHHFDLLVFLSIGLTFLGFVMLVLYFVNRSG
ncbi:MAG: hypothetical protein ACYC1Q_02805 [Bacteroidia bacterium]